MNQRTKLKKGEISRKNISEGKTKGLEKKIVKIPLYEDEKGKFMHYCNSPWHKGAMYQEKVDKIREEEYKGKLYDCNQCHHYSKIYLPK